jgi:hypothetical protein
MQFKKYDFFAGAKNYNIIYIEGMNENGSLNNDAPNEFNDRRIIIEFVNKIPKIVNQWEATTEPGTYYTENPMNPNGAARIAFGQYKSWQVGIHYGGGSEPHEALVQTRDITIHRDRNQDFMRTGDNIYTGIFEMNQHWGFDYPRNDISYAGAGCLVGRRREGHREFMKIVKADRRYQLNNSYAFLTTIIAGDDLVKQVPAT